MKKKDILVSLAIIAAAGLTLLFYSQRTGYVGIDAGGAQAVLQLKQNWLGHKTITSGDKPAAISARIYRPQCLSLSMGQDEHAWKMESYGPWGECSTINVKNKETTVLKFGPPFLIKPAVHRSSPQIRTIDFSIIGRAGEKYQYNRSAPAPKIKIIDEQGNVLATGNFGFG
jgi:hypothetical protein